MNDTQLLREFRDRGSQEAFSKVMKRHYGFVLATCLRELSSRTMAEDATQVVFLLLSKKARRISANVSLAGWLFQAARWICKDMRNQERRRKERDRKMLEAVPDESADGLWDKLEPSLNDGLAVLSAKDRDVVLMRYFEGMSLAETGAALGVSEDAAQKRGTRALARLRAYFQRQGIVTQSSSLATVLTAHAALWRLLPTVGIGRPSTSPHLIKLTEGIIKKMAITKLAIAATAVVLAIPTAAVICTATIHAAPGNWSHAITARLAQADTSFKWPVIPAAPTPPSPNAFDTYNVAYAMVAPNTVADNWDAEGSGAASKYSQSQLDAAAAENLPVVAKIREGFGYAYQAPAHRSFKDVYPYYAHDRELARILAFEGSYSAQEGKYDDALTYDLDAIRLGSDVANDEGLIPPLVCYAMESTGRRYAWDLVSHVSSAEGIEAARRIQEIDAKLPSAAKSGASEELSTQAALMDLFKDPQWRQDAGSDLPSELSAESDETIMKGYTDYMTAEVQWASLPYDAFLRTPEPASPSTAYAKLGKFRAKRELAYAMNELLATSLALQAYMDDNGSYPAALGALTPKYLSTVPADPFNDNKPLTYKLSAPGYLLYSVGPDGKDDGGKAIEDPAKQGDERYRVTGDPSEEGDIVAGANI